MSIQDDPQDQDDFEFAPSKSAIKREAERLKKIGEQLLDLTPNQLQSLNLEETLAAAIEESRRIKSREGLRRHKQYIGKLLREMDTAEIETYLGQLNDAHTLNTRAFHQLEQLRDQLISGDKNQIGEVIARFPSVDTQKLRQLVRNAKKEQQQNEAQPDGNATQTSHSRKLFRFLRDISTDV